MVTHLGFYLLFMCLVSSLYGVVASFSAAWWRHRRLYLSAKAAATVNLGLTLGACGVMVYSLYSRDFSNTYVAKNSSIDLPPLYTLTALWSSLEGSHLLWTTLIVLMTAIAAWTYDKANEHIMPFCLGCCLLVQAWMCYLLVSYSDPFVLNLPSPTNGNGMNELLQNPYMAIHPPLLFVGYTAAVVPFAYACAALFHGDISEGWLRSVRRWTLVAWCFLGAAIILGGRWAYVELGWAGYWAWDPVENASFLPWLTMTAALHTLLVQEKLGHLKRMSLILCIATFFLTFFGTFITRSGVISSVHAFGEGPVGPNYLVFLAGIALFTSILYAIRAPSILPSENEKVWGISKESALALAQFIFIAYAVIILVGTIFPIISEALTQQRISVQAPYFNVFSPYVGAAILLLLAVGQLMRYQTSKMPGAKGVLIVSGVLAIPFTLIMAHLGDVWPLSRGFNLYAQLIGLWLCGYCLFGLLGDFYLKFKDMRFRWPIMWQHNRAYLGATLVHVGFVIAIIGFLGNYRGLEKRVTLTKGESAELFGFEFKLADSIQVKEIANTTLFIAPMEVSRFGKKLYDLEPAQSRYPTKPGQSFNEIAVAGNIWHDVYIVLADLDKATGNRATLSLHINPTVKFVWLAIAIMVVGGLLAATDRHRGNRSRDTLAARWQIKGGAA